MHLSLSPKRAVATAVSAAAIAGALTAPHLVRPARAASAGRAAHGIDTNIRSYVVSRLDDFKATMDVVNVNTRELSKISRDAVMLYTIKTVHVSYKEPNMIRIEGTKDGSHVTFVLNGQRQWVRVNGFTYKRDWDKSPGKRKSLMDVGLVSDYYLTYTNARFLREGSVDGVPCAVFDMSYKDRADDSSHHIVYIDPRRRVVLKREAFSQSGQLQATYLFKDVREVAPGIWFPTVVEAQNADRAVAGTTAYRDIQVNVRLSDDLFKL